MIVILGGSGFIGRAFQESLTRSGLSFEVVSRRTVDYTDERTLVAFLRERRPEFLINAAGYVGTPNIDACELNKVECLRTNTSLPGIIRTACEQSNIPWGHVSSGCIYTGSKQNNSGFTEQDCPNFSFRQDNCSFYSGCKALAEEILIGADKCYIWRPRMPFSHTDSPRNYISKVLNYEKLLDATNSLSQLNEFADACVDCWKRHVPYGVYNLTNPGSATTRQVVALIQRFRLSDRQFQYFESEDEFMRLVAKAPRSNCVLDCSKAISVGLKLTDVSLALEHAVQMWQS